MNTEKNAGAAFERLLQKETRNPDLWVPGISNFGMDAVIKAMEGLSDEKIVRIIREAAKEGR